MADAVPITGRGAAPSGVPPLLAGDVRYIAIHCSATPPTQDLGVKDIDRMHRMRGFLSCGYHFVIRRNGKVETGRALTQRGAHVEDFNWCSIGVCLIGGVDSKLKPEANFTEEQLDALAHEVLPALKRYFPSAKVQGHRDFPHVAKACPSFDVGHWLTFGRVKP